LDISLVIRQARQQPILPLPGARIGKARPTGTRGQDPRRGEGFLRCGRVRFDHRTNCRWRRRRKHGLTRHTRQASDEKAVDGISCGRACSAQPRALSRVRLLYHARRNHLSTLRGRRARGRQDLRGGCGPAPGCRGRSRAIAWQRPRFTSSSPGCLSFGCLNPKTRFVHSF
jgi:hypothetical protein